VSAATGVLKAISVSLSIIFSQFSGKPEGAFTLFLKIVSRYHPIMLAVKTFFYYALLC